MPRRVYANMIAFFKGNPGLRAMDLADELGISYSYLSMIKWGQREPDLDLAIRIVDRCAVPLESLVLPKRRRAS